MTRTADKIRKEMHDVRCDLAEDMEEVVESAREMTDWRVYVKRYPWLCVGAAAALGFVAVPSRVEIVSPDIDALAKLVKSNRLVAKSDTETKASSGMAGAMLGLIGNTLVRAGIAYVGQQFGKATGTTAAETHS